MTFVFFYLLGMTISATLYMLTDDRDAYPSDAPVVMFFISAWPIGIILWVFAAGGYYLKKHKCGRSVNRWVSNKYNTGRRFMRGLIGLS